ncbi:dethiobiotin synthase [Volucribacter amazonae]|uniref:ATP-dependent dethiobiotin synthetase BioD n=1 Tax=Volucribacter amazonae TaxID=256731 RepID=A0A9X4SH11_9PAST|nr:dethiobiotin synthase [Volucribacter amazonae]MDG6894177.1 dethiobiotin synthase [Volucribacter amazonae]
MSSFFITGTDTNVGKTIASRAIIQALQQQNVQIVGYKPIAYNADSSVYATPPQQYQDNLDVKILMHSSQQNLPYEQANSYTFEQSQMLTLACQDLVDLNKINQNLDHLIKTYQSVLVEGTFGWLTPINREMSFADWVKQRNMPVILVVGIKEGCINHGLLTAQAIAQTGVPLLGWVANRINPCLGHYAEVIDVLSNKIDAPLLGEIPYLYKPEEQALGHYLTNIERLSYLQTALVG